jgi:DNA repair protein RadC
MNHGQTALFNEDKPQSGGVKIEKCLKLAEVEIIYKSKIKPSEMHKISSSADCYELFKLMFDQDKIEYREEFIVMMLNRAQKVLGWVKLSSGGVAGTVVDQKMVFQAAINANASSIIVAHNHPSGNLKPSEADIKITNTIKEGGKILDIALLDHLIVTTEGYYSFADEGLI